MKKNCFYCDLESEIYLKSNNLIDLNKIDFSCTEKNSLNIDESPLKPNLFICKNCKIIFSEFNDVKFEQKYSDVVDNLYIDQIDYKKLYFKNLIKKIKGELSKKKDILEIGSYYGAFGSEVVDYVNTYTGIEMSNHAVNFAREKYKLNVHNKNVEDHFKESKNYDLIVMFDVMEHFDDPIKIIKSCNKKLNKDGVLIFSTMNMDSFVARFLGKRYPWIMLMHKFYFTNKSLKKILKENNFDLYKIKYDTRIISIEYLLDKIQIHFPYFRKVLNFIKKFDKIKKIKIKISFFDLNIYFAKKI